MSIDCPIGGGSARHISLLSQILIRIVYTTTVKGCYIKSKLLSFYRLDMRAKLLSFYRLDFSCVQDNWSWIKLTRRDCLAFSLKCWLYEMYHYSALHSIATSDRNSHGKEACSTIKNISPYTEGVPSRVILISVYL